MKKALSLNILFLLSLSSAFGQTNSGTIKGIVTDTLSQALPFSNIVLMEASDSTIYQFATADESGAFELKKIKRGDYILNASFIGYATFQKKISTKENSSFDLGSIALILKPKELSAVVVVAEMIPISLNGDTLEYNALAFKTRANATVEDLLKRLPGIEIDREGGIKAQGQSIHKVMVNGKEFFGNDPKIATQNLMAEGIAKVQVFYKNTDLAEFTGIDDGSGQVTINLKLKKNRLKGYFGTVMAGYGTNHKNRGQFNINKFSDKTQLSFIGMANNINKGGFSSIKNLQNQALKNGINEGIVTTKAGGINFNREFGSKIDWQSSYFYSNIGQTIDRNTFRESVSAGDAYSSNDTSTINTTNNSHNFDGILRYKFNATNELIWISKAKINDNLNKNQSYIYRTGETITQQNSRNISKTTLKVSDLNSDILYRHRFKKTGRFAVANFNLKHIENNSNFRLIALTDSLSNTKNNSRDNSVLNQFQNNGTVKTYLTAEMSFVYTFGHKGNLHLETNYGTGIKVRSVANRFETNVSNVKLTLFNSDYTYHEPSLKFKFFNDDFLFNAGATMHFSTLSNSGISKEIQNNRNFKYFVPNLLFRYKISRETELTTDYNSSVIEPAVELMQPITYNLNQFNSFTGNPNLRPELRHEASLNFRTYSQFSFTGFSARVGVSKTEDKILQSVSIDSLLFRNTSWVNSGTETRTFFNTHFSTPLNFMGSKINVGFDFSMVNNTILINKVSDKVNWQNSQFSFSIENKKKSHLDILAGLKLAKNKSQYQVNKALNNDFLRKSFYGDMTLYLFKTWEFYSSMNYELLGNTGQKATDKIPLWTASVSTSFLNNEKARVSFAVYDALNANKNFSQTSSLNYIQTEQTNALGRYFMLSFSYKLSKFNK